MALYKDVEGYRKLFDEEYKKTRKLISEGETHLDNIAEGFSEASSVIDRMPTADVVPKSEVERLEKEKAELLVSKETDIHISMEKLVNVRTEHPIFKAIEEKVAREIFEEIEKDIDRALSVITKILKSKGGRTCGKTVLISKYDVFIEAKKRLAELKKKYTEGEE